MAKNNINLEKYNDLCRRYEKFNKEKIPLCAAENYTSDFVKTPLSSLWCGKYSISNQSANASSDFIGGEFVRELAEITAAQCNKIFNVKYSNPKTLTGMNCFTVAVMSCMEYCINKKALITTPDCGGHASVPTILSALGFENESLPFDFKKFDIDYEKANTLLRKNEYGLIVIALSDLLQQPNIDKIDIPEDTIIIFDATQTLGLIAAKLCDNPLHSKHQDTLLIGGTHKTLPGPSCGLIMTNSSKLFQGIDNNITPVFLRDFQPSNTASLLMALIEFEEVGEDYQKNIIRTANILAEKMNNLGLRVANIAGKYTQTHQIFLKTTQEEMEQIYNNALKYGITLNKKNKPLFGGYGIRIGVQEIARYLWGEQELEMLAELVSLLRKTDINNNHIKAMISYLANKKNPHYILL